MFGSKTDLDQRIALATAIAPIVLANLPPGPNRTDQENARAVSDGVCILVETLMKDLKEQTSKK